MRHCLPYFIKLPPYDSLSRYEGQGNYAIKTYYRFPQRFFYRHKLKMIVKLMSKPWYWNVLDFGSGPGIFSKELSRHASRVILYDYGDVINPLWRFRLIVCASVLEFCELDFTLKLLRSLLYKNGEIIVASPMNTRLSRWYFRLIKDKQVRHSHQKILEKFSDYFRIEKYEEWFGLYFAVRGVAK